MSELNICSDLNNFVFPWWFVVLHKSPRLLFFFFALSVTEFKNFFCLITQPNFQVRTIRSAWYF